MDWRNLDYRAVTAGAFFLLLAGVATIATPTSTLLCDYGKGHCHFERRSSLKSEGEEIQISRIERAKKQCVEGKVSSDCKYEIKVAGKGLDLVVLSGYAQADEAQHAVNQINTFVADPLHPPLLLKRRGDLTWSWLLLGPGVLLLVLGIRKNMTDKGM